MLSNEEIDRLNRFCLEHYVGYYDVRLELVDHLASSIEAMGDVPLDTALEKVYQQFGEEDFSGVEKRMTSAYLRRIRVLYRSYFARPKAAFTLTLGVGLYSLQFFYGFGQLRWFMLCGVALLWVTEVSTALRFRKFRVTRDKPLLLLKKAGTLFLPSATWASGALDYCLIMPGWNDRYVYDEQVAGNFCFPYRP